jgi:hypothetical protein
VLVLFDDNIPRGLAVRFPATAFIEARERGWGALKNSDLLRAAEDASFQVMVTPDKRINISRILNAARSHS